MKLRFELEFTQHGVYATSPDVAGLLVSGRAAFRNSRNRDVREYTANGWG